MGLCHMQRSLCLLLCVPLRMPRALLVWNCDPWVMNMHAWRHVAAPAAAGHVLELGRRHSSRAMSCCCCCCFKSKDLLHAHARARPLRTEQVAMQML